MIEAPPRHPGESPEPRTGAHAGRAVAIGILFLMLLGCGGRPTNDADEWWSHVAFLANDSLRGRDTGSPGYLEAARYVASQFHRYGVEPGGATGSSSRVTDRYLQPVRFVSRRLRETESALSLVRDGTVLPLPLGTAAVLSAGLESADSLEAPMVFVGYGLSVPEAGHDDLAGVDLRGKVAVYIRGGPDSMPGPLRAHAQTTDIRWKGMRAAGAVGTGSITPPRMSEIAWERAMLSRHKPSLVLDGPDLDEVPGMGLSFRVNPAEAERLFEGSGHTFAEMRALADSGRQMPTFPLRGSVRSRVRFDKTYAESPNVVGVIRGRDPKLRDQYVVVSAHLDHLGIGAAVRGDSIYNGAMDNASGVASLIEFARLAQQSDTTFRRSVILLALTGEEKGLEGSRYFAAYPTVPMRSIVADVNLDMFLPIFPMRSVIAYGLQESDLGDWFVVAARRAGVTVMDDPEPQRRIFTRSDQYSFIRRGVPALSFKLGYARGSREERLAKEWQRNRYHAPSDDLAQPVDKHAAVAFTRLLFEFTREIANRDEVPGWKPGSFFRRFAP